jgi:very-short-patch-repair endonuclease
MSSPRPSQPRFQYADDRITAFERAERAVDLRRRESPPEGILWSRLRGRNAGGFKFRRQHPMGSYVLDFYCADARLAVEVDSRFHDGRREHDARRDEWLWMNGVEVVRVSASDVTTNLERVVEMILLAARRKVGSSEEKKK